VPEDRRAHRPRDLLELLLPAAGLRIGNVLLADDAVEDQVEQAVLGADVPVQGGRRGVQRARHVAHAQLVEAVGIENAQCGVDDRLLRQRLAPAALRRPCPWWRGKRLHLNDVRTLERLARFGGRR
jgi:hypothetical protein